VDFCLSPLEATFHEGDRNRNSEGQSGHSLAQKKRKTERERIDSDNPVNENHRVIVQTISVRHKETIKIVL